VEKPRSKILRFCVFLIYAKILIHPRLYVIIESRSQESSNFGIGTRKKRSTDIKTIILEKRFCMFIVSKAE